MTKILVSGAAKGGTQKTTTAVNIAVELAKNQTVCLIDADKQRSAAKWIERRHDADLIDKNLTIIEKLGNLTDTLTKLSDHFDFIIVDTQGDNSKELITSLVVADLLISPHQATTLDMETVEELQIQLENCLSLNPKLKPFLFQCKTFPNHQSKGSERTDFLEYASYFPNFKILETVGYYRKLYQHSCDSGKTVIELDNKSAAAAEIQTLLEEIKTILEI
jgi:chromosome partitioning protein